MKIKEQSQTEFLELLKSIFPKLTPCIFDVFEIANDLKSYASSSYITVLGTETHSVLMKSSEVLSEVLTEVKFPKKVHRNGIYSQCNNHGKLV